ncbi:hypothetical protein LCGC14_3097420, partial [marine sediment metagenome]
QKTHSRDGKAAGSGTPVGAQGLSIPQDMAGQWVRFRGSGRRGRYGQISSQDGNTIEGKRPDGSAFGFDLEDYAKDKEPLFTLLGPDQPDEAKNAIPATALAEYHDTFVNYANNPRGGRKPLWSMLTSTMGQSITREELQDYFERVMSQVYEFMQERSLYKNELKRIADEDPWIKTAWKKDFDTWYDTTEITIYRGVRPGETSAAKHFRSYTLNPRVAKKFSSGTFGGGSGTGWREEVKGGKVLRRKVRPRDIMGFFTGGYESEVIMPIGIVGKALDEPCEECYT